MSEGKSRGMPHFMRGDAIPVRFVGALSAVRVTCDGKPYLAGAATGDQWREALGVPANRDLWAKNGFLDELVAGDTIFHVPPDIEFYTAPRRISDS